MNLKAKRKSIVWQQSILLAMGELMLIISSALMIFVYILVLDILFYQFDLLL